MNTLDYINEVQYDDLYDRPYGEIDYLLLAELSYLPFDDLVPSSFSPHEAKRLVDLAPKLPHDPSPLMTERYSLLEAMVASKRYKNLKLVGFQNIIKSEENVQFSAIIFCLKPQTYVLAFRGTDDSLVGWKEDLLMSYLDEVPAQYLAKSYLDQALQKLEGDIVITGHSKGGNLAIYAASQAKEEFQKKLSHIYSFDGPGLHTTILSSNSYQNIHPKIQRYIPENSVVGVLLYSQAPAHIIQSSVRNGMAQHNTFTWEIEDHQFKRKNKLSTGSQQLAQTMLHLVEQVPDKELANVIQTFFSLLEEEGITSINVFFQRNAISPILKVIQRSQTLSPEQRDLLFKFGQFFLQLRQEVRKETSERDLTDP
ncbi:Mbeg1-like protein [Streptococcus sp. NLN76]|uniref:Mbeg1-like protein n=1 Tax=Streptococcus sp. NLN76 TaxID=2822800 RepID=UPI0018AA2E1B|nr:Mbeg1-like protein [Streptococcus sp. NLN76]MBF8969932.1 DUF2974 domain-containing protein [Streptococcus sp. NLN76]